MYTAGGGLWVLGESESATIYFTLSVLSSSGKTNSAMTSSYFNYTLGNFHKFCCHFSENYEKKLLASHPQTLKYEIKVRRGI